MVRPHFLMVKYGLLVLLSACGLNVSTHSARSVNSSPLAPLLLRFRAVYLYRAFY